MFFAGGIVQGTDQENAARSFVVSVQSVLPYLRGATIGVLLLTGAHFIFVFHFGLMILGLGRTSTVPTFLNPVETEGAEPH